MFDAQTLLNLGLSNQVISIWQVFAFIIVMIPFLLLQRVKLCLLITYLFSYYLAFLIYWGDFITTSGSMIPFILYIACGVLIVILFAAASLSERRVKGAKRF